MEQELAKASHSTRYQSCAGIQGSFGKMMMKQRGQVTTFYSYKGGVGRTFLLANVAWLLARWGRRVLCLDWDLEAPGLYRYLAADAPPREGVLDLVLQLKRTGPLPNWREVCQQVNGPWVEGGELQFIGAGRRDDVFITQVQSLNWDMLSERGLETALERIREEWVQEYDHVLIDSRTGITDAGGICAAQLPDLLVVTFTATYQSLEGAVDVARRAQTARERMPIDRGSFPVLPIPCRIHTGEEEGLEKEWSQHFEKYLDVLFAPWKDRSIPTREYIAHLRVREQARWSFGEQLPVRSETIDDPNRISYAFANIAALVDKRLTDTGGIVRQRHEYVASAAGNAGLAAPDSAAQFDYDVFISYPRQEWEAVQQLAFHLRQEGMRVFFDADVPLGANWVEALYSARERSRMFVVLIPPYELGIGQAEEIPHIVRRMTEQSGIMVPIFLSHEAVTRAPDALKPIFGLVLPDDGPWDRIAQKIALQVQRLQAPMRPSR
jgi:MinD-like ATPase involved in chromosome partitioning or flagellar assembly